MKRTVYHEMIEGLEIERVQRDYEFSMPTKHFHNEYEIYYLVEGERYYFIENQTYLVGRGNLVLVNKKQIHKTSMGAISNHDRILLEIQGEVFEPIAEQLGFNLEKFFSKSYGVYELGTGDKEYVDNLFRDMEHELSQKATGYEAVIKMRIIELIIYADRTKKSFCVQKPVETVQTAKHQKVHEVAEYIIQNYQDSLSLDIIAQKFYVSKCYLSRIFKEVTGFTVNEFINMQKIRAAQELLMKRDYNITEISKLLGYESITYFEKVFRKYVETSPLKFRKKQEGMKEILREKRSE